MLHHIVIKSLFYKDFFIFKNGKATSQATFLIKTKKGIGVMVAFSSINYMEENCNFRYILIITQKK